MKKDRIYELALIGAGMRLEQITAELNTLSKMFGGKAGKAVKTAVRPVHKRTAKQRAAISKRMKAYWKARNASK